MLLGASYALGTVNRFREGGWRNAALAPSGLAGASVFLGLVLLGAGLYARTRVAHRLAGAGR